MRHNDKAFTHLSLQDAKSIEPILKAITKGLASGELKFIDDEDELVLNPQGLLRLKVSAVNTKSRHQLRIKISWDVEDDNLDKKASLKVTSAASKKSCT